MLLLSPALSCGSHRCVDVWHAAVKWQSSSSSLLLRIIVIPSSMQRWLCSYSSGYKVTHLDHLILVGKTIKIDDARKRTWFIWIIVSCRRTCYSQYSSVCVVCVFSFQTLFKDSALYSQHFCSNHHGCEVVFPPKDYSVSFIFLGKKARNLFFAYTYFHGSSSYLCCGIWISPAASHSFH